VFRFILILRPQSYQKTISPGGGSAGWEFKN
jgi:hypothetical protein